MPRPLTGLSLLDTAAPPACGRAASSLPCQPPGGTGVARCAAGQRPALPTARGWMLGSWLLGSWLLGRCRKLVARQPCCTARATHRPRWRGGARAHLGRWAACLPALLERCVRPQLPGNHLPGNHLGGLPACWSAAYGRAAWHSCTCLATNCLATNCLPCWSPVCGRCARHLPARAGIQAQSH